MAPKQASYMRFSIIICAYNASATVARAIRSVFSQALPSFELIVVNDGSEDDTLAIAEKAVAECRERTNCHVPVVFVDLPENAGLFAARKRGMSKATGDYVLFLDADDELESHATQRLESALAVRPVDVLGFAFRSAVEGSDETRLKKPAERFSLEALTRGKVAQTVFARCYSLALVRRAIPHLEDRWCVMAEDVVYSIVFSALATSYATLEEPIYRYWCGGGVSTNPHLTPPERLIQLTSLVNARDMSERFVRSVRPDCLPATRAYLTRIVDQNERRILDSPYTNAAKLQLLDYIDREFGTGYATEFRRSHPSL